MDNALIAGDTHVPAANACFRALAFICLNDLERVFFNCSPIAANRPLVAEEGLEPPTRGL